MASGVYQVRWDYILITSFLFIKKTIGFHYWNIELIIILIKYYLMLHRNNNKITQFFPATNIVQLCYDLCFGSVIIVVHQIGKFGPDECRFLWILINYCCCHTCPGVKKSTSPTPGASNLQIRASWNNQLYARRASKKYRILTNLSIFAYLLIFIYVICCLISSNVLFIQPLAFCRNWEQRR